MNERIKKHKFGPWVEPRVKWSKFKNNRGGFGIGTLVEVKVNRHLSITGSRDGVHYKWHKLSVWVKIDTFKHRCFLSIHFTDPFRSSASVR